ncbi:GNAT family N-acetyltransferase [Brachybacterium endophyticum]|uniref:GNAT family N-acetyltransferase n=1 Tax=Brachybacterium endophyticum TaxID=2182385 RepID=A0A2U2RPB3_9MICO|nr:GNAT family N-acetyltransferase [Brachybacterium endophyticum]PWH07707.1 GNAT family N-acetyltransferase [Brachybacterium endophyticum]
MLLTDHFPPRLPDSPGAPLASRVPIESDVDGVAGLLRAHLDTIDPETPLDVEDLRSRMVGLHSWSRRQVVIVPAEADGTASLEAAPLAWIALEDRARGRTDLQWVIAPDAPVRQELASTLMTWAFEVAGSFARHRGVETTQLTADIDERDTDGAAQLAAGGLEQVRTWLHMRRPTRAEEATSLPAPRPSVRVRRVHRHPSGLPLAQDVRSVHRMLEESFADHFSSYRESFAEFSQRLLEAPRTADWDLWWIAEVDHGEDEGGWLPAGGLVASTSPAHGSLGEGTYLDYLGVHRSARGHGVAKALLHAAIADAARRGRDHVDLEVDADSPTGADGLYTSMGWETFERTQSWHADASAHASRLLEPEGVEGE